jgi:leucyl aminopeptidase (aminopeptidase T)
LAIQIRALGAFPLIWVTSDELNRRMYSEVPATYDSQQPLLLNDLYKIVDTQINVDYGGNQDFNFFASADQKRLAAQAAAGSQAAKAFLSSNRRFIEVGNGIFPNPPNAALFGVTQPALADAFWAAMNANSSKMQAASAALQSTIGAGTTMHVTNPNGTDISFGLKGVTFVSSTGAISADCTGAKCIASLPAGDMNVVPTPGTANGKIVIDNIYWGKDVIKGFTVTFSNGVVTSMSSANPTDLAKLKAAYDAGGQGRDQFAALDIGLNTNAKNIPNSTMLTSVAGGSVSFAFGNNLGFGGSNASPFGFFGTQPGSTVTVDGKPIVSNGALVAGM